MQEVVQKIQILAGSQVKFRDPGVANPVNNDTEKLGTKS
jgi:hypothetical protein